MFDTFDTYQLGNIIESSIVPGAVKLQNNYTSRYFRKYLFEKAISVFKWELPYNFDKDYFLYVLYIMGYIGIIPTDEYGVIPQYGTISGFNLYYAPRYLIVSNPLLKTKQYTIHEDCELIKLQGNYTGIWDIVCYYASKMALISESIDMNLVNSKSSKIFFAKDKASAESMKKIYDQITAGNPAVVTDKQLLNEDGKPSWLWFVDNLKQNYIVNDLLIDLRKIENQFCTDLGIPNTNTDKRERMTDDEVNANNEETYTRTRLWLERLQDCCTKVNDKYNLNIKVDWRVNPDERNFKPVGNVSSTSYNSGRSTNSGRT